MVAASRRAAVETSPEPLEALARLGLAVVDSADWDWPFPDLAAAGSAVEGLD